MENNTFGSKKGSVASPHQKLRGIPFPHPNLGISRERETNYATLQAI